MHVGIIFAYVLIMCWYMMCWELELNIPCHDNHNHNLAIMSYDTVTNGDEELAEALAQQLREAVWSRRKGFVYEACPLSQSLQAAKLLLSTARQKGGGEVAGGRSSSLEGGAAGTGPVLLLDHSDNVMSGGTCDTTGNVMSILTETARNIQDTRIG